MFEFGLEVAILDVKWVKHLHEQTPLRFVYYMVANIDYQFDGV